MPNHDRLRIDRRIFDTDDRQAIEADTSQDGVTFERPET
jgi:hypothetical protein